ncbi:hypothetical protein CEXT_714721 [Caerostris extrusa]|uniref:Uncharacterized protein n=1 Tax=Caerostris extrusa TaxID=172846 RepID=A0AAV4U3Y0_CAEEX|nr:hypothetical protein CEXT_714721 [Caerostris extrusa]
MWRAKRKVVFHVRDADDALGRMNRHGIWEMLVAPQVVKKEFYLCKIFNLLRLFLIGVISHISCKTFQTSSNRCYRLTLLSEVQG